MVLDRQLQDTIYQFEHARGVVVKIDKDSAQLAEALAGEQARIIITTLQKFPFVLDKIGDLPNRRYAVIVDEAHSSQTGEAAKDLRLVLGATEEQELTVAEAEDAGFIAEAVDPVEEALAKAVGARGRQANLSFFAFTATPKARTLEMFGTWHPETGQLRAVPPVLDAPGHRGGLHPRRARQLHDLPDLLADREGDRRGPRLRGARRPGVPSPGSSRCTLQPGPEGRDHRRALPQPTPPPRSAARPRPWWSPPPASTPSATSRPSTRYIAEKGYADLAALVAFSGKVIDEKGLTYTEPQMNGFPESQTAERFGSDDYQVLIVAEKFQTGFDQPLLHTMYVDKVLTGLNAVQTLSRLNRIHPAEGRTPSSSTSATTPRTSSRRSSRTTGGPWPRRPTRTCCSTPGAGSTSTTCCEPRRSRPRSRCSSRSTDRRTTAASTRSSTRPWSGSRHSDEEDRLGFKDALDKFVRTYSFLSQVVSFGDSKLERDYIYCRALGLAAARRSTAVERLDLGSEVELTHLRDEVTFEGSLSLDADTGEVKTIFGEGGAAKHEPPVEPLSEIVDELNERFGLNLDERDQLLFDQFEETWVADPEVVAQAQNNTFENFRLVFDRMFMDTVVGRMDDNEAIFKRILDDEEFRQVLMDLYASRVYQRSREGPGSVAE